MKCRFSLRLMQVVLLMVLSRSAAATELSLTDQELAWRKVHPVIRLGFTISAEPFLIQKSDGSLAGAYPDICAALETETGIGFEIELGKWADVTAKARRRELDGMLACTSELAQDNGMLSIPPFTLLSPAAFIRTDSEFRINDLNDFRGKRIAYRKGSLLHSNLLKQIGDDKIIILVNTELEAMQLVLENKADIAFGHGHGKYLIAKNGLHGITMSRLFPNHARGMGMAIRSDWPELVSILQKGLAAVGESRIQQILNRWINHSPASPGLALSQEEEDWLAQHPQMDVIVEADAAPYAFLNGRGEFTGIMGDIFHIISQKTDIEFSFEARQYAQLVDHVKTADKPIICGFDPLDDPSVSERYLMTQEIVFMPFALFANTPTQTDGFAPGTISGKRIAVIEGWNRAHPALLALGNCEIITAPTHSACINLVLRREVDAIYEIAPVLNYQLQKQMIQNIHLMQTTSYGMPVNILVRKDHSVFHSILEKTISTISRKQRIALLDKWKVSMKDPSHQLLSIDLTEAERRWLLAHPVIRISGDPDWQPIEWFDDRGTHYGLAADYRKLFSKYLGVEFETVHYPSWQEALTSTKTRKTDMLPCVAITPNRADHFIFSPPYLSLALKLYVREETGYIHDLSELSGKRLALISSHAIEEHLKRDWPQIQLHRFETLEAAISAVESGRAHAFIAEMLTTGHALNALGVHTLKVGGDTPYTYDLAVGVRKDWPEFASIMRKTLQVIPRGEQAAIYQRWAPLTPPPVDYSFVWKIGLPLLSMLVIVLVWNWMLKREVRRRTADVIESHERLEEAEKIACLGHWQLDIAGNRIHWSEQVARIIGAADVDDTPTLEQFLQLFHPDERSELQHACQAAIDSGTPLDRDQRLITGNGTTKHVHIQSRMSQSNNGGNYLLGILQDITDRKTMEETLRQSDKLQAVGQLTGGIAHDFNNMLGGIMGAAELLGRKLPDDPKLKSYHNMILSGAERAAGLTRKLLAFARKETVMSTVIDVHPVIDDAAWLLKSSIDRLVTVEITLNAPSAAVVGDPAQLQNAVLNLGINAAHAMPEGGIISISTSQIELNSAYCTASPYTISCGSYLDIQVRDNGCGIAEEIQHRIFDPFFTTKEQGKGTGLGLAAVHGTIEQHKGAITVNSEVDVGTTFHLLLPLAAAEPQFVSRGQKLISGNGTLLIIDDDTTVRVTARAILEDLGYSVLEAEDGEQGVSIYREKGDAIDLVILDMIMPVMNGRDCFHALKAINPDVRVLLSSGFSEHSDLQELEREGLHGFIRKPFLSAPLSSAVHDAMSNSPR